MNQNHSFWNNQPALQLNQSSEKEGFIKKSLNIQETEMPDSLEWWNPDISNDNDVKFIYHFLNKNYIEDDDNMFRLKYSVDLLRWCLLVPGYIPEWHLAIRKKDNKKIIGFITGIPINIKIGDDIKKICEINFLCIHKKLRNLNLTPLLIKEITNRTVAIKNIYQAVYTVAKIITKPFSRGQYWGRLLNPIKMIEIGFSSIPTSLYKKTGHSISVSELNSFYDVNLKIKLNMRSMEKEDIKSVHTLLNNYLKNFEVSQLFDEQEIKHLLLPRENVIYTFVVETKGKVTDFISFYKLSSLILNSEKYSKYDTAYCYYYSANTVCIKDLIENTLMIAQNLGFDVFQILNIMDNQEAIKNENLKFEEGTGVLHYYLYNWVYHDVPSNKNGLIMV